MQGCLIENAHLMFVLILIFTFSAFHKITNTFLCLIHDCSMFPTFEDGDIVLVKPFNETKHLELGSIYLYTLPDGRLAVKRLLETLRDDWCYFVGDNGAVSKDSRQYGYVHKTRIVAQVTHMCAYRKEEKLCITMLPMMEWERRTSQNTEKPVYHQAQTF